MLASLDRSALPYWEARSASWGVATPISPGADDILFYEAGAARNARPDGDTIALLLGVTPAIAAMRWPRGTRLAALDWADGMLRRVFPRGGAPERSSRLRGDWREMPLAAVCADFVVGDGCYSTFPDFEGPARMNREVARVLRPGGEFCLRCHRRPDAPASVPEFFARLRSGAIRDLDMFRWILAMAVHGDSTRGVPLAGVWRVWHEHVPDVRAEQARLGWSAQAVANTESWRDARSRYVFPSLAELRGLAADAFELV